MTLDATLAEPDYERFQEDDGSGYWFARLEEKPPSRLISDATVAASVAASMLRAAWITAEEVPPHDRW